MSAFARGHIRVTVRVVGLVVLFLAGDLSVASAQIRVRGPFAGLFAANQGARNAPSLNFDASVFGVWQQVLFPSDFDETLLDPTFDKSGAFAGAVAQLAYSFDRRTTGSALFAHARGWTSDYSVNAK